MDEYIDILNAKGQFTGKVGLKSEAHRLGLYHASVHCWLYTPDRKVIVQQRASDKDSFPNLWDISVAGHIGQGESPEETAVREIQEEIGYDVQASDLKKKSVLQASKEPKPGFYDNEFHHIFLVRFQGKIKDLHLQKEEVQDIKCISIAQFTNEIQDSIMAKNYVPHGENYYKFILDHIERAIRNDEL